jgi:arginyl-tRNA synthetase
VETCRFLAVHVNIVENIKQSLLTITAQAAEDAKNAGELSFEILPDFVLEVPREKTHGDFAVNLAMLLAKEAKRNPRQVAQILVDKIDTTATQIVKIEIAGPGFINFHLEKAWIYDTMPVIASMGDEYGKTNIGNGKKVQVEFVSANPTGLLHMGNARGAALGDSIASLLTMAGFDVSREFYINDTGNQIENFAKSLEARYFQALGNDVEMPEDGYQGEDIKDTIKGFIEKYGSTYLDVAEAERRTFMAEYALQEKLEGIKTALAGFGVEYDCWYSEKNLHQSGKVSAVIEELQAKGYIYENEGALWFKSTLFGDEKDEVVVRKNGIPTYFASDIAYHKDKFERGFDWVINIWGADHHGHVSRMKGSMAAIGHDPDALTIILMQLVRLFKDGDILRMSKRTGQFVTLNELVEEVGRDAARYFFVMRSADSHLEFDLDLAKSQSQDNPVFYVQYAHARISSILRQCVESGYSIPDFASVNFSLLDTVEEFNFIRKLADFPGEVAEAAISLEPHRMTRFAHELAGLFHAFYAKCRVLTEDESLRDARIALIAAGRQVLRNVLAIIDVSAPEKM